MMNSLNKIIPSIAMVLFLMGSFKAEAQAPIAKAGPNGIFVYFGKIIPYNFNYILERRVSPGNDNWDEIYRTVPPDYQYRGVVAKLLEIGNKSVSFSLPDSASVLRFISLVPGKKTTDSIYVFNTQPAYIELLGTGFYDVSTAQGEAYEYRVSEVDRQGNVLKSTVFKTEPFPGKADLKRPEFLGYSSTSKSILLNFTIVGENNPSGVRVFKQVAFQTDFAECYPFAMYSKGKTGTELTLIDSLMVPGVTYRYLVLPIDLLGNPGSPSDTVNVNFGRGTIAPLENFYATTENIAIVLHWKTPDQQNMRGVSILRSEHFDDGYQLLDRVPASDSTYFDQQIVKGISYYYYLVFQGLTETSTPSAKVIGMVEEKEKPNFAPGSLTAQLTKQGNLINWSCTEGRIKGYYVYRGEGYTVANQLISSLVLSDSLNVAYLDSTKNLFPGQSYCYAVSAVNRGNLEGPHSGVVIVEPLKPDLPVPLNVQVKNHCDKAMVLWDDISSMSDFISGYQVYRSEPGDDKMKLIARIKSNVYNDTTIVRGKTYRYSLSSIGIQNSESPYSETVDFGLPVILPVAPAGLRAAKTDNGVIVHWDQPAVLGLSGFKVYRERLGGEKKMIATVKPDINNYTEQLPEPGTYFYTVTSLTVLGAESTKGEEVGVKVE